MIATRRAPVESALEPLNGRGERLSEDKSLPNEYRSDARRKRDRPWKLFRIFWDEHRCVNKRRRGATSVRDRLSLLAFHAPTGAPHPPMRFLIADEIRDSSWSP